MKITDLKFDNKQFGQKIHLVKVEPYFEYKKNEKNGKDEPTDKLLGHKYTVVLLDADYEKITVKIEGKRLIEEQEKYDIPIKFNGLEVGFYQDFTTKNLFLTATAKNIEILK